MKRLWPAGLAGQLMLVAALALVLAQGINLALLVRAQRQQLFEATAAASAAHAMEAMERLENNAVAARTDPRFSDDQPQPSSLRDFRRGRRAIIADRPMIDPQFEDWPEMATRVSSHLAEAGMTVTAVRAAAAPQAVERANGWPMRPRLHQRRGRPVMVAMQLQDGRWVTVRNRIFAPARRVGRLLIGQTLLLFGMLLGPLLFIAWRVTRPLAHLTRAARDTRPTALSEPIEESGPEDVRLLTRAFNTMRERIGAMLQEKDRMLGAIGHDLRTPLASLRVRAESVSDDKLRAAMVSSIEDMAAMLDDIVTLARAGQSKEVVEPTDVAALVAAIVDDYRAMGKPVTGVQGDGASLVHSLRPLSLSRAVRNLIDNALTYGGSADVSVTEWGSGGVRISIADNGPGIPADRIADLMEPFARGEASRNRDTGGAGLGLALARAAVQAEGGTLSLANRPGGGLLAEIRLT